MTAKSAVLLYSGGLDSTVLLYDLHASGADVRGFGVDYGQSHKRELNAAEEICRDLGIPYDVAKIQAWFRGSILTEKPIRGGPVPAEAVVVPNRNMVFLSLATSYALSHGASEVYFATQFGDFSLFPDCRPQFLHAANEAIQLATEGKVRLHWPYAQLSKAEVVRRGVRLRVPFEKTWSCYEGGQEPCGKCLACKERETALRVGGYVPNQQAV